MSILPCYYKWLGDSLTMRKGFTLVELSVVLVIIGLLIGGVLVGQSMLKTTKIQRFIRDLERYQVAVSNFRENYKYYPGDSPLFTPPGNGDNAIGYGAAGNLVNCNGAYYNQEGTQFFAHLSQAKMLDKNYVPYSPQVCPGGTHTGTDQEAGLFTPYTELNAQAAAATLIPGHFRHTIYARSQSGSIFLDIYVNTEDVIPMENKLGIASFGSVGLYNIAGSNRCFTSSFAPVPCSDPTAAVGDLWYTFR